VTEWVRRLSLPSKIALTLAVWGRFFRIYVGTKRRSLPRLIEGLRSAGKASPARIEPRRLGRIVERTLRLGPWRARCLFTSLVLYRLLREQGEHPQFVIGLPREPRDKDAHAWVEIDGRDVGPPPGRSGHQELARYA
jgi:hypothetical protein